VPETPSGASRPTERLSLPEARQAALAAQGFTTAFPSPEAVVRHLGLLQFDPVGVFVPAHYLVLYSRLGPYDRALADGAIRYSRQFTEQWAHEASIIPVETWPLLKHRMAQHRLRPWPFDQLLERHPGYLESVLEALRQRGPLTPAEIEPPAGVARRLTSDWGGSVPRAALEALFGRGLAASSARLPNHARVYDLPEQLIPSKHRNRTIAPGAARRELLTIAARALGVATAADLADYFRLRRTDAKPAIQELVEAGTLSPVAVEGWKESAYLAPEAQTGGMRQGALLISPFDPLVWFRPRTLRLFGFHYRIGIYTPAAKREYGYYDIPVLLDDQLVARLDLRANVRGKLEVQGAWAEPGRDPEQIALPIARELHRAAAWLDQEGIRVLRKGNLSGALRRAVSR